MLWIREPSMEYFLIEQFQNDRVDALEGGFEVAKPRKSEENGE